MVIDSEPASPSVCSIRAARYASLVSAMDSGALMFDTILVGSHGSISQSVLDADVELASQGSVRKVSVCFLERVKRSFDGMEIAS